MERWKIRRELARAKQQLLCLPELITDPIKVRQHDAAFRAGFPTHEGDLSVEDRVALYLIFQPDGIADSVLDTCRHLVSKGYSPLIVSNASLSDSDLARLKPVMWRAMERPNFGYDFGGYRDGVLSLRDWGISPEFLCILNDSIWYPLYDSDTLIETSEAQDQAISGSILRETGADRFLESYFFMIPASVHRRDDFQAYWKRLKLTSNKYKVIRRGERGFSRAMVGAGIDLCPAHSDDDYFSGLHNADASFLRLSLRYAAFPDEGLRRQRDTLLQADGENWRNEALAFIQGTYPKRMHYSAFPFAMTQLTHYPILKKSGDPVAVAWRKAMIAAWDNGDLPAPRDVVRREVENARPGRLL